MKKFAMLFIFWFFQAQGWAQPSFVRDSLDEYIKTGMKDWNIPGLAIAIVKDGKIIVSKGYGVTDLDTRTPVTDRTLFMIASNTKLFTGTALAQLEYDKKLSLDDKITKYFPDFKAYDETTTQLVTIKDMLGHHLGTKTFQGDFTFWNSALNRDEIIHRIRYLKPSTGFRTSYGYCNSCFVAAGEVIPIVTGKSWEDYIHDSLLVPLGMTDTRSCPRNLKVTHSGKLSQVTMIGEGGHAAEETVASAIPYSNDAAGNLRAIPFSRTDNLAPAASLLSSARDLGRWLQMQLDSGRLDGKQVVPWAVLQKTRDVNTAISSRKNGTTHFKAYGLGVFEYDYYGREIFYHSGGADGFLSSTCFVPEENLGIVVLTNNDDQVFFDLLRIQILDAYLGAPYGNKSKKALPAHIANLNKTKLEIDSLKSRVVGNVPELPLSAYTGTYRNELYGTIDITAKGKELNIRFNSHKNLQARLQYMEDGEWLMTYNDISFGIFETKFAIENSKVVSIETRVNDEIEMDPYTFLKSEK